MSSSVYSKELKVEKVSTSSIENNRPELREENAVDGNIHTRWASEQSDSQWICFDLGSLKEFDSMSILWEAAYARIYEIQISDDMQSWVAIYTEEEGKGDTDLIYLGKQKARYIRIYCIKRATEWGYSIFEVKIEIKELDDGLIPSKPTGLSGVFTDEVVFLDWHDNSESDIHHYDIYRSSKNDTEFIKLNFKPINESKYKDENIDSGIEYYYYIKAIDFAGNESPESEIISGVPILLSGRNFFKVPTCAWKHYVGDIPDSCISTSPDRGIALGGFGAGSFMYTINGSFGPFQTFDSTLYKGIWLSEAAFHVYEKVGKKNPEVKCLATGDYLKKSWDKIRTGDAIYYGLQPKGWISYNCFETDISQKFFSPIIPRNYQEISYPVGVWQFKFYNPGDEDIEIGVMLTFPGIYVGENVSVNIWNWGETKVQVGQARSVLRELEYLQAQLKDGIALEVKRSLLNLEEAKKMIKVSEKAVIQAKESLDSTQIGYKNGRVDNVEVLAAQLALTETQTNHLEAIYNCILSQARLEKAIGLSADLSPDLSSEALAKEGALAKEEVKVSAKKSGGE
jgi:hypothetical protein